MMISPIRRFPSSLDNLYSALWVHDEVLNLTQRRSSDPHGSMVKVKSISIAQQGLGAREMNSSLIQALVKWDLGTFTYHIELQRFLCHVKPLLASRAIVKIQ